MVSYFSKNIHPQSHYFVDVVVLKHAVSQDLSILWHENYHNEQAGVGMLSVEGPEWSTAWFWSPRSWNTCQNSSWYQTTGHTKKMGENNQLCFMHLFSPGCAFTRNSCNRAVCFPSLRNYCAGQEKYLASGIILFRYCTFSLMSLFCIPSPPLCNHVQTCSYGLRGLKQNERVKLYLIKRGRWREKFLAFVFLSHPLYF